MSSCCLMVLVLLGKMKNGTEMLRYNKTHPEIKQCNLNRSTQVVRLN